MASLFLYILQVCVTYLCLSAESDKQWASLPGQREGEAVSRVYEAALLSNVSVEVYSAAQARTPTLARLKASAAVVVEARLTAVELLVDGKGPNVTLGQDKPTNLTVHVTPPEAYDTAHLVWFVNDKSHPVVSRDFSYTFFTPGEWSLHVEGGNLVSSVRSPEVRVLVVQEIDGVRGLADHDSVHMWKPRNYTVLVGRGSHITYTWDFGFFHNPTNTTVPTIEYTYRFPGTYTLTVQLSTPLGDRHVVTSKVFVLESGTCDTPKVLGFYPQDLTTERESVGNRGSRRAAATDPS